MVRQTRQLGKRQCAPKSARVRQVGLKNVPVEGGSEEMCQRHLLLASVSRSWRRRPLGSARGEQGGGGGGGAVGGGGGGLSGGGPGGRPEVAPAPEQEGSAGPCRGQPAVAAAG